MCIRDSPRYEGALRVQFASRDEWHYGEVCYGQLAKRSLGGRRSRMMHYTPPEHKVTREGIQARRAHDLPYNLVSLISEAYCLQGLHGCARHVGWPIAWYADKCYLGHPPRDGIIDDNVVGRHAPWLQAEFEPVSYTHLRAHETLRSRMPSSA